MMMSLEGSVIVSPIGSHAWISRIETQLWGRMENREALSEPLTTGVYELPGEPVVVINGVPDAAPKDPDFTTSNAQTEAETPRITGFGEWLEGREVRKFFGEKYYPGTVTEYDKETGWYRVVYEDGDFEDLEWHELREVLQPLDVSVSLRTLALRIIRKSQKSNLSSGKKKGGTGKKRGRPRKVVPADSTGLTQP